LALYRSIRRVDSIYIDTLRSVNKTYLSQNAELLDKNTRLTKWLWITSILSAILIILQ
jgi:hypothetical protein